MHYSRLSKRSYKKHIYLWDENSDEFRCLRLELGSDGRLKRGRLREISQQTGIAYKTLESWRSRLRQDPSWEPEYGHAGVPRVLDEDTEASIAARLDAEYMSTNRYCPTAVIQSAIQDEGRRIHGNDFVAGRSLVRNFLTRNNLSMRRPHVKRRTAPDDSAISEFLARMDLVRMQFPPQLIINMDETCWRLLNGEVRTLARTGADDVRVLSKLTAKSDITVIASCTASGERLPLWAIAKGKTALCEAKYRQSSRLRAVLGRQLFIDHSPTGWSTSAVIKRYLVWLKEQRGDRLVHVLWDLHASHRHAAVCDLAQEQEIGLSFIPAGQTDQWQPLDRRLFGSLKQRARRILAEKMIEHNLEEFDLADALRILVEAWSNITEEEVLKAWDPIIG